MNYRPSWIAGKSNKKIWEACMTAYSYAIKIKLIHVAWAANGPKQVPFRNLFPKGGCFETFSRGGLFLEGTRQWSWRVEHVAAAGGTRQ